MYVVVRCCLVLVGVHDLLLSAICQLVHDVWVLTDSRIVREKTKNKNNRVTVLVKRSDV